MRACVCVCVCVCDSDLSTDIIKDRVLQHSGSPHRNILKMKVVKESITKHL